MLAGEKVEIQEIQKVKKKSIFWGGGGKFGKFDLLRAKNDIFPANILNFLDPPCREVDIGAEFDPQNHHN